MPAAQAREGLRQEAVEAVLHPDSPIRKTERTKTAEGKSRAIPGHAQGALSRCVIDPECESSDNLGD